MITIDEFSPQFLVVAWGIIQSLVFEYIPGVAPWYSKYSDVQKRGIQALGLLLVTVVVALATCVGWLGGLACDEVGLLGMFGVWFTALVANQTTHSIAKKPSK